MCILKIFVGLGTNLFANLRFFIFLFYVVTVALFLGIGYYFLQVVTDISPVLVGGVLLLLVVLCGIFIAKLALDPLVEYVENLQNLSKETLHELNLPISTITTNTQMLQKNTDDAKMLKRISRIESACTMLQQRYNELDYLIKTQTKQQILELFDLAEIVQQRIDFLQKVYPQAIFDVSLETSMVQSDKIGLQKVIDNVVDNGVKYSKNIPKLTIRLHQGMLSIRDEGIGMDEVEIVKIFDNYYQKDSTMQGFGIGLAMVKRFCDANSVILQVRSQPNKGTVVSLQFKERK